MVRGDAVPWGPCGEGDSLGVVGGICQEWEGAGALVRERFTWWVAEELSPAQARDLLQNSSQTYLLYKKQNDLLPA